MAAPGWRSDRPLSAQLRSDYARFDFHQLVRLLLRERAGAGGPSALERHVRFRGDLSLVFPAHEVTAVEETSGAGRVSVKTPNYGIAGYLGPLPESFAEWAHQRRAEGDGAMADFLDLFTDRVNALRFRLKARLHPVLDHAPPEDSPQAERLAALIGLAEPGLAHQVPLPKRGLLGVAGLLANRRRTVAAMERVLARYFATSVTISQFHGAWRPMPEEDQTRLGRRNGRLGKDALLGRRAWDQAARIEVRLGPLPYSTFRALLPGGARHATLAGLLRFLTDRQVDCRVVLLLDGEPPTATATRDADAGVRLAHTAWLPRPAAPPAGPPRATAFIVPAYDDTDTELDHAA